MQNPPEKRFDWDEPRRSQEPPKTCGQWLMAFILTGICGIVVLAIWDWDVWKKFAAVVWLFIAAWIVLSLCLRG